MKTKAFLGIDVSKGYADFILLDEDKQVLEETFQLDDNKAGREQLSELFDPWFDSGIEELYCAVESTGLGSAETKTTGMNTYAERLLRRM